MAVRNARDAYSPATHLASSFMLSDAEEAYARVLRDEACMQQVVRSLPPGSEPSMAAADARLWNTLLGLVQVRGTTWLERWDAVRVSIGLDPMDEGSLEMEDLDAALDALSDGSIDSIPSHELYTYARSLREAQAPLSTTPPGSPPHERISVHSVWPYASRTKSPSLKAVRTEQTDRNDVADPVMSAAERLHSMRLLKSAFCAWHDLLRRLRVHYGHVSRAADKMAAIRALEKWEYALQERRRLDELSASLAATLVKRRTFALWKSRHKLRAETRRNEQVAALRKAFHTVEMHRNGRLAAAALNRWSQLLQLCHMERQRTLYSLSTAWNEWRGRFNERQLRAVSYISSSNRALGAWRGRLAQERELEEMGARYAQEREARSVQRAFHTWLLSTRSLSASVMRSRTTVALAWQRWWMQHASRTARLNAAAEHVAMQSDRHMAMQALRKWRMCLESNTQRGDRAARAYSLRVAGGAFDAWRQRMAGVSEINSLASGLADAAVLRRALVSWRVALENAKADRLFMASQQRLAGSVLLVWREKHAIKAHYRTSTALLHEQIKEHRARATFDRWLGLVLARRDAEWDATQAYESALAKRALANWRAALHRAEQQTRKCAQVAEEVGRRRQARVFDAWRHKAAVRRALSRREALAEATIQVSLARRKLLKWRDAAIEARLREPEFRVMAARMHSLQRRTFNRWKDCSRMLPAINTCRKNTLRRALSKWIQRKETSSKSRISQQFVRDTLLRDAFAQWRRKAAQMHEIRALERMGVPRERLRHGRRIRSRRFSRIR
ncbi:hypothetical protein MCUN1_000412 [Malassezia cuniculi]|uniref:Sfi1 spindle body domain-containing protein n=1 Tax=Malassezia cuniculi TaxID=948313 RepID=A0AAF0J5N9_9BASI|nr:hypothetical protein MCUN1_000412 [Malassezia cuniculi]